jgi:FMN phosphatase YigB (HAD superfamily)
MPLTLAEYADELDERRLLWPRVPQPIGVKATASIKPLRGVRAVLWDVYGTLLRISDGRYTLFPKQDERLQIALDKTIREFNMWNHMYRQPGPPWQSMISQYRNYAERLGMQAPLRRGDITDIDIIELWQQIVERLFDKDYVIDEPQFGSLPQFCEKVAWFFHCSLQGIEAREHAVRALADLSGAGMIQGLLSDGPSFTLIHTLRALSRQGTLPPLFELFRPETMVFSSSLGIRKPSPTLFESALSGLQRRGISPNETLHISCRLETDLMPARAAGMKTALLAAEKTGLEVTSALLKDPQVRPDRLLTDLSQISEVIGLSS